MNAGTDEANNKPGGGLMIYILTDGRNGRPIHRGKNTRLAFQIKGMYDRSGFRIRMKTIPESKEDAKCAS